MLFGCFSLRLVALWTLTPRRSVVACWGIEAEPLLQPIAVSTDSLLRPPVNSVWLQQLMTHFALPNPWQHSNVTRPTHMLSLQWPQRAAQRTVFASRKALFTEICSVGKQAGLRSGAPLSDPRPLPEIHPLPCQYRAVQGSICYQCTSSQSVWRTRETYVIAALYTV